LKKNILYYFLCAVGTTVLFSCGERNPLPSLAETYSRTDKNPFGTYVAFRQVNELFYRNDVRVKKVSVDKSFDDNYNDTSSLYICISEQFYLRRTEMVSLLNYVNRGNNVFISARYFDTAFLKEMNVSVTNNALSLNLASSLDMKKTNVQLSAPPYTDDAAYSYFYLPLKNSFTIIPAAENVKVLGMNETGDPNFVVLFYGKGRVYLHCEPRVFGNYFLLKENNYKYLQHTFSFMPRIPDSVFWDDFYNRRYYPPKENDNAREEESGNKSGLSVLFKYPAMAWAFWLSLLLLLLYILFGSKRRQRIVKPVAATENTSVAFTETVGRLYLQKKDNRNIADKMVMYLLEHIRNQYFLNTNNLNTDFTAMLSRKANVPQEQVERLFTTIGRVQKTDKVDDQLLLSLNGQIENFYKHK
jgi:hypothetical protein